MTKKNVFILIHNFSLRIFNCIRLAYYRRVFGNKTIELYFPFYVNPTSRLSLGNNVAISSFVHIVANGGVTIGDNTIIAAGVKITSSTHDVAHFPYRNKRIDEPVSIGKNVWIGSGAVILSGISIDDNAIIGAGSVVTRDVPANAIVAGVPAKVLRYTTQQNINSTSCN